MKTSQRRKAGRVGSPGGGTSSALPAASARWSVIAALSVITVPSGSTRVGSWATGLTFANSCRAASEMNRSPTSSSR